MQSTQPVQTKDFRDSIAVAIGVIGVIGAGDLFAPARGALMLDGGYSLESRSDAVRSVRSYAMTKGRKRA